MSAAGRGMAVSLGLLADRIIGEPRGPVHPVAVFGSTMTKIEERIWADARGRGVAYAALAISLGAAGGTVVGSVALGCWLASSGRALGDAAEAVGQALSRGDLESARGLLGHLVGRDATGLGEGDIARAVVESVAENTVDGIVAPAWWAGIGGSVGTLIHRAVDTADSMVGYRTAKYRNFGWASARADDLAAWVPARIMVGAVMVARPASARAVWASLSSARSHPSPNSGLAEAAFAGALGVSVGGPNTYGGVVERRPVLGQGPPARPRDIQRAITLSRDVTYVLAAFAALPGLFGVLRASGKHLAGLLGALGSPAELGA